jgi:hypothetical protein
MNRHGLVFMMEDGQPRRSAMRTILGVLGVMIAAAGLTSRAEAAPVYRWCANYDARDIVTCAYDTFQQCLDSAGGGAGGYCSENPVWHPAPAAAPRPKAKRRTQ